MRESTLDPRRLSDIAARYGLVLHGQDREVVALGPLSSGSAHRSALLTFVTAPSWLEVFASGDLAAAIVPEALVGQVPDGKALLATSGDPEEIFYALLADTVEAGEWQELRSSVGDGTVIAPTAVVEEGVVIGRDCRIGHHAVVLANTHIGDRVVIKPNATVGGEGYQVRELAGRRRVIPHAGGVDLGDDVHVGSSTCVDRGLFGDFTTLGAGTKVDNLVHVAHSVVTGRDVAIVACAEVSGSVRLGDGAWIGPNASINQSLAIGDHALLGTGGVAVRDLPAHGLAYGNPARLAGWVCVDRTKLELQGDDRARCPACGREYVVDGTNLRAA